MIRRLLVHAALATAFLFSSVAPDEAMISNGISRSISASSTVVQARVMRLGRGAYGGRAAVVRGPVRGGAFVRGPYGGRAAIIRPGGAAVLGRRYYGGVWYGHVRRFYGGRWWPYGVGACWRSSPIGYVWVCR